MDGKEAFDLRRHWEMFDMPPEETCAPLVGLDQILTVYMLLVVAMEDCWTAIGQQG